MTKLNASPQDNNGQIAKKIRKAISRIVSALICICIIIAAGYSTAIYCWPEIVPYHEKFMPAVEWTKAAYARIAFGSQDKKTATDLQEQYQQYSGKIKNIAKMLELRNDKERECVAAKEEIAKAISAKESELQSYNSALALPPNPSGEICANNIAMARQQAETACLMAVNQCLSLRHAQEEVTKLSAPLDTLKRRHDDYINSLTRTGNAVNAIDVKADDGGILHNKLTVAQAEFDALQKTDEALVESYQQVAAIRIAPADEIIAQASDQTNATVESLFMSEQMPVAEYQKKFGLTDYYAKAKADKIAAEKAAAEAKLKADADAKAAAEAQAKTEAERQKQIEVAKATEERLKAEADAAAKVATAETMAAKAKIAENESRNLATKTAPIPNRPIITNVSASLRIVPKLEEPPDPPQASRPLVINNLYLSDRTLCQRARERVKRSCAFWPQNDYEKRELQDINRKYLSMDQLTATVIMFYLVDPKDSLADVPLLNIVRQALDEYKHRNDSSVKQYRLKYRDDFNKLKSTILLNQPGSNVPPDYIQLPYNCIYGRNPKHH